MNGPARTRGTGEEPHLEIALSGAMTIEHAADHRQRLLVADAHPGPVALDLGDVTTIDITGIQLLLAIARSLESRSCPLLLHAVPPAVENALALLGLELGEPRMPAMATIGTGALP